MCFDSFRFGLFLIDFSRFRVSLWAPFFNQTCITFLLSVFILNPQPHSPTTPDPTTPQTHKHKNMARRNARSRSEYAAPIPGAKRAEQHLRISSSKASARPAHSARPVPKDGTTFGPQVSDLFRLVGLRLTDISHFPTILVLSFLALISHRFGVRI